MEAVFQAFADYGEYTMTHTVRRSDFTWHSRQDLYDYFGGNYSLSEDLVDEEILKALAQFAVRKGAPVNMEQLWQKSGESLIKKCSET